MSLMLTFWFAPDESSFGKLTSGTPLSFAATRLRSFLPAYLCKCEENSDSIE